MEQKTRLLTLLFADISRSSHLYKAVGDQAAQKLIGKILEWLTDVTVRFKGTVVKTVGDSIVCTFHSTDDAVEAAKAMQQMMINKSSDPEKMPPVNIHIGIHHGSVILNNKDVFGDAVNVAARVMDYAKPRQIVATRTVIDNLSRYSSRHEKYLSKITAKNISGEIEVFEIVYENQETTMILDSRQLTDALSLSLHLITEGQVMIVDAKRPMVSVGREDFNDIVMKYSWISRTHAYIENRSGIFMVNDKSTNGTFIYPYQSEPIYINKGEHPLSGKGIIVFGREIEKEVDTKLADKLGYEIK